MDAIRTPDDRRLSRSGSHRVRRGCALLALALASGAPSVAQEPVAAVWQPRKVSFYYSSATAIFSCSAIAGRVSSILRAVGARDDLKVTTSGCTESDIPSPPGHPNPGVPISHQDPLSSRAVAPGADTRQQVHVYVRLMLPTEVTPEVLAELNKDKSRRELVARVTGNPAARFNDPVLFSAQWQPVTLSHKTIGITSEECELLDQMSPRVFRDLGLRDTRNNFRCSHDSHISPTMVVEALLPAPPPAASRAPEFPATGDDDTDPSAPAGASDDGQVEPPSSDGQ